ncbi:MAG: hypothetical protein H6855_06140 [Rhodospirillales bacterium]|nr:hypothetical protein [Rhodospirillales bacterium]MCB9965643.1 hypothetical protein [Rhodospirillales bacterium]MCB9973067.1 hypothetical protein [Rhodospirillales bacterium]
MTLKNRFYSLSATLGLLIFFLAERAYAGGVVATCATGDDVNCITDNLLTNSYFLPGLVSIAAYLSGLALGVKAVLDMVKHTTAGPREMPIRTPIIEFVVCGLLLALPVLYETLITTAMGGNVKTWGGMSFFSAGGASGKIYITLNGVVTTIADPGSACLNAQFAGMISGIFCNMWDHISNIPGLLSGFSYIAGLTLMYFATISLKQSVENPGQVSLWVPFQRYVVATLLLVLPWSLDVAARTLLGGMGTQTTTDFNLHNGAAIGGGEGNAQSLDLVVSNFVFNIHGIIKFVLAGFSYMAGMVLIIMGVFRLMKTMQDGPRGPGGIGTIMTFITGAALLALGPTMGAFATTLFGDSTAETKVDLTIPGGGLTAYEDRLENFISAVLAYMLILGWISFVRGLFIFRSVAEGAQQASMMSAITHLLGGTILVNLGPFLTAVQSTLGPIAGLPGLTFS